MTTAFSTETRIAGGDALPATGCPADTLSRNLAALRGSSAETVAKVLAAAPYAAAALAFSETDDGVPTASLGTGAGGAARQLASRRRPLDEARRLISPVDLTQAAVFVVAGFGLGYHVAELARKVGRSGVVVVFEPDAALLRSVLERIDHSEWLSSTNVCILTDPANITAMSEVLRGVEGFVGMGVKLIEHPPSVPRLGSTTSAFFGQFAGVVDAVKLTVVTTLVQVRVTMRNLLQNLGVYGAACGVGDLKDACTGRPAIVVSAGPSLRRNIDLLSRPGVRDRFVIIAVQTVLKTLLARGIKPHFVTALDYSEISKRFYEGLTPADVEGITLVVEPKVNPSVLDAWPNKPSIRCIGDRTLDLLLGRDLKQREQAHEYLRPGATVAHLAYYLARHLGCDPAVLIGQDLGFTDGQYYAAGAAIHGVWAGELNEFNTLEMLEFQRIARMGAHLRSATDTLGRPIRTDEQMLTYLRQFEQDFKLDQQRGLTTIDATEGGVRKEHTALALLRDVLAHPAPQHAALAPLPRRFGIPPTTNLAAIRTNKLEDRVISAQRQCARIGEISRTAAAVLTEIIEHHADQIRVDRLLDKIDTLTREVTALDPAFTLVQLLGQSMVFNRIRHDRLISLEDGLSPLERQKRQAERDLENVRATSRTAAELGTLLADALSALRTGVRQCHDIPSEKMLTEQNALAHAPHATSNDHKSANHPTATVAAIIPVDLARSGLNTPRSLAAPVCGAPSILSATLRRLRRCDRVRRIALLTDDVDACRALLSDDDLRGSTQVVFVRVPAEQVHARRAPVASARLFARDCWRGGIANLSIFDELFEPVILAQTLDHLKADGALLVGPDWCVVDPDLCDQVVERFTEDPLRHRLTLTQAAPGLCGCVIAASLVREIASSPARIRANAGIGGLLGYQPNAPIPDLLGTRVCVTVDPAVRDGGAGGGIRFIADSEDAAEALANIDPIADAHSIVRSHAHPLARAIGVHDLVVSLSPNATPAGLGKALRDHHKSDARTRAITLILAPNTTAQHAAAFVRAAIADGVGAAGIHIRFAADSIGPDAAAWLATGAAILSIDTNPANTNHLAALGVLADARAAHTSGDDFRADVPWIVPRLTRSDATYPHVERFLNEWMLRCGWAVLDPLREAREHDRIAPLPLPPAAAARLARSRLAIEVRE